MRDVDAYSRRASETEIRLGSSAKNRINKSEVARESYVGPAVADKRVVKQGLVKPN